jgi:mycothiol synthase
MQSTNINQKNIHVKDAPAIPGLNFRGFRGEADYPVMVDILRACQETDQIERVDTVEDIANAYRHLVNCDPYQDMLFCQIDDQPIGYSRVSWIRELNGDMIYKHHGILHPDWRRKGIGRAMLHYNQDRLRQIASGHKGSSARFFSSGAADTEYGAEALLISEGYQVIRHFYNMVRPDLENIPDAPLPPGLEVRPVLPEHYQTILDANHEAFRDHWGFSEDYQPKLEEWMEDRNFDPSLWKVAWDGDQVAGMVLNYIDKLENEQYQRKRGWTEDICVRRPWRKRGLASALIALSLHMLKEMGMEEAALGVDTENLSGALKLYERMGYQPVKRFSAYRKAF